MIKSCSGSCSFPCPVPVRQRTPEQPICPGHRLSILQKLSTFAGGPPRDPLNHFFLLLISFVRVLGSCCGDCFSKNAQQGCTPWSVARELPDSLYRSPGGSLLRLIFSLFLPSLSIPCIHALDSSSVFSFTTFSTQRIPEISTEQKGSKCSIRKIAARSPWQFLAESHGPTAKKHSSAKENSEVERYG